MSTSRGRAVLAAALVWAGGLASLAAADDEPAADHRPRCVNVRADLVEDFSNTGCEPPSTACFLGVVRGTHFLRGTTRFDADSGAAGPPTSPGFVSYSGIFEYFTERGKITTRETGVVNNTQGNPESGAVTAFQKITSADGDLAGATGHFFVSGFSINNHVVTKVTGRVCLP